MYVKVAFAIDSAELMETIGVGGWQGKHMCTRGETGFYSRGRIGTSFLNQKSANRLYTSRQTQNLQNPHG